MPAASAQSESVIKPEKHEEQPEKRDLDGGMRRVRIDELREEREEEERGLRIEHVDHDPLREGTAQVPLAAESHVGLRALREQRPEPETDQIDGASGLDRGERHGRRENERRETERRRTHMDERADVDAEHRDEPCPAPVVHRARNDVEDGRPGHDQQSQRRDDVDADGRRVRNHAFSSHTRRRPSSVRNGSMLSIVSECGATRSARPPVAMARASTPSSPRMRPTIPSTCPAKP